MQSEDSRTKPKRLARVVTTGLMAATFGAFGCSLASWAGWHTAAGLPSNSEAISVVQSVFPEASIAEIRRDDRLFTYAWGPDNDDSMVRVFGGDDYGPGYVRVVLIPNAPASQHLEEATNRLTAAGWHVRQDRLYGVLAAKEDLSLRAVGDECCGFDRREAVEIDFERTEPMIAKWAGLGGWALGAAVGWMFANVLWTRGRRFTRVCAVAGVVALLFHTFQVAALLFLAWPLPDTLPPLPIWGVYMELEPRLLALGGMSALVLAAGSTVKELVASRKGAEVSPS